MSYSSDNLWSDAEDGAVRTFYPRHGRKWDGWSEVLPKRTIRAIGMRAVRLGIKAPPRKKKSKYATDAYRRETITAALMDQGMTPTEIDTKMHWRHGTAVKAMSSRWERQREQEDD